MINVHQAAAAATDFLRSVVKDVYDLRVEEVELTDDGRCWLITLGFADNPVVLAHERGYKQFRVNAVTGEVESMKIRTVA